jgi:glycerol-3-phosphate dehydrogenase
MGPDRYDMIVVGGGIHGAGVAQAAAAAGHRVLLLEKAALGAGTSSRSSKLIHGGLRYLETGQIRLVHECLRERRILLEVAPDLVRLEHFYLPLYRETRRRDWQLLTGLSLYALLAGFRRGTGFKRLSPARAGDLDGLNCEGLQAVYRYVDARTDDAALTRAVTASAVSLGARVAVPAELVGASLEPDGCTVRIRRGDEEREARCRVLVNAAGPWANAVLDRIEPRPRGTETSLVQGAHLVIPGRGIGHCYYVENPRDGRGIFVLPWRGGTLVGTTETPFAGDPDTVEPRASEQRYLRSALLHHFPQFESALGQGVEAFAGLRVLPAGDGHAFHRPRETRLITDRDQRPRVLTIYGGKLTAYRATAARVVARLATALPATRPRGDTRRLPLTPADADCAG